MEHVDGRDHAVCVDALEVEGEPGLGAEREVHRVVVAPQVPRFTADGSDLSVKLISDAYAKKETGEEYS